MPSKKTNGVKSWSLSALQLYETCPARFKAERIDKRVKKVTVPAMERGIDIHAKGEQYLLGTIPNVPNEYKPFAKEMRNLRKYGAEAERKVAVNQKWEQTGFFDRDAWLRLVVDVEMEFDDGSILLIDFKTGRIYPDKHDDQSHLYATVYLGDYPAVSTEFWYLDQDHISTTGYNDICVDDFRDYWTQRSASMFSDTKWETTPDKNACRYCGIKEECPDAAT